MVRALLVFLFLLLPSTILAESAERIAVSEVKAWLDSGEKVVFLDTRNDYAWSGSSRLIPGAIRVHDNESFGRLLDQLPRTAKVVAYCT